MGQTDPPRVNPGGAPFLTVIKLLVASRRIRRVAVAMRGWSRERAAPPPATADALRCPAPRGPKRRPAQPHPSHRHLHLTRRQLRRQGLPWVHQAHREVPSTHHRTLNSHLPHRRLPREDGGVHGDPLAIIVN
eukprot:5404351-Prymnesium_polylepis.1